jgi:hypothetical protein
MGNPDTDPSPVLADIIDSTGNNLTQFLVSDVMHQSRFGLAMWWPFPASPFEIPDQLFLLGIHGNERMTLAEKARAWALRYSN